MTLYYGDLAVGTLLTSPARTVTETDIVSFAMLSGDWNPIHVDAEFAKRTHFGRRVAHGLFGMALMTGLMDRAGWFDGSVIAMLGIDGWRFLRPIFDGDTLHCTVEIVGKRMSAKGDRGIVERHLRLVDQRGEVVQEGNINVLVRLNADSVEDA